MREEEKSKIENKQLLENSTQIKKYKNKSEAKNILWSFSKKNI